jgi:hypothetical protein
MTDSELQKVRERVAKKLALECTGIQGDATKFWEREADAILAIDGIEIRSDDQLPPDFMLISDGDCELIREAYDKANFIKVIKK